MKKKLLKVMISVMLVATVMTAMVSVANAQTKNFNVTADNKPGWISSDPYTPRAQKSCDGDHKYYVRVLSMSGSCPFVNFYMYRYIDPDKKTTYAYTEYLRFPRSAIGECWTQDYNAYAPGGSYYFMEMVPYYGYCNINCTGRFTP